MLKLLTHSEHPTCLILIIGYDTFSKCSYCMKKLQTHTVSQVFLIAKCSKILANYGLQTLFGSFLVELLRGDTLDFTLTIGRTVASAGEFSCLTQSRSRDYKQRLSAGSRFPEVVSSGFFSNQASKCTWKVGTCSAVRRMFMVVPKHKMFLVKVTLGGQQALCNSELVHCSVANE